MLVLDLKLGLVVEGGGWKTADILCKKL